VEKRTPSQAGKLARNKGRAWEQTVRRAYAAALGEDGNATRAGWKQAHGLGDADVAADLPAGLPWGAVWTECKVGAQPNIAAAMAQAVAAMEGNVLPVVASKRDRCVPLVTLRFDDWMLLMAVIGGKNVER
jgi:hypothetical protein